MSDRVITSIEMSLNSSTLIGMMMAIGKLVDDSIIVIDSIDRKLREGLRPRQAAIQGTGEVFLASAAASCVMIAALLPTILAGGLTGLMFVGIVWPMVFAFIASLIVSVTLIPLIAAFVLKPPQQRRQRKTWLQWLLTPVRVGFQKLEQGYGWLLDRCMNNREVTLAIAGSAIVFAIALYPFVPQEMMPLGDSGQFTASLEMEPGTSFAKTDENTYRFEQILLAQPDIDKVSSQTGFELTLSSVSILGIIILSGLSLSAAILLLELILAKREEGVPRDVAIRMAGPVRLKAITMTTLTTIIVIVRLAFFPEIGMDAYSPIATVILGGLLLSTLLTLVVVPVVYSFIDDATEWLKRRGRRRRMAQHPDVI
ncbi:MAG: efflux RND transporter permease subunit [Coleofasciculus sp. G2-EDA-02]